MLTKISSFGSGIFQLVRSKYSFFASTTWGSSSFELNSSMSSINCMKTQRRCLLDLLILVDGLQGSWKLKPLMIHHKRTLHHQNTSFGIDVVLILLEKQSRCIGQHTMITWLALYAGWFRPKRMLKAPILCIILTSRIVLEKFWWSPQKDQSANFVSSMTQFQSKHSEKKNKDSDLTRIGGKGKSEFHEIQRGRGDPWRTVIPQLGFNSIFEFI